MVKQIVVTGATGFVGRHVVAKLLERDCKVIVAVRDPSRLRALDWFSEVTAVPFDMSSGKMDLLPEPTTGLIHLAWAGLPDYRSLANFEESAQWSYNFIKRLVRKGLKKVLVTGTCFEFGLTEGPVRPDDKTDPITPYGFAKDCLHKQLLYLQHDVEFTLQWPRLFFMYGEGQNSKSLIPLLDQAIDKGEDVFDMSGGEQLRDYLPIESVAEQLLDIFFNKGDGNFHVCSENPISVRKLVERRIKERDSTITLNLGYYPYPEYEPMAFWGKK